MSLKPKAIWAAPTESLAIGYCVADDLVSLFLGPLTLQWSRK